MKQDELLQHENSDMFLFENVKNIVLNEERFAEIAGKLEN